MEFFTCSKCPDRYFAETGMLNAHIVEEHTKFKVTKGEFESIELQTVLKKMFLGYTDSRVIPLQKAREWSKDPNISIHEFETETFEDEIETETKKETKIETSDKLIVELTKVVNAKAKGLEAYF
jgi:uncharacterized protein YdaT